MISEKGSQEASLRKINMLGLYLEILGNRGRLLSRREAGLATVRRINRAVVETGVRETREESGQLPRLKA